MRSNIASTKSIAVFLSLTLMLGWRFDSAISLGQAQSRTKAKSPGPPQHQPLSASRSRTPPEVAIQPALQQFRAEFAEGRYEMAAMTLNDSAGHFYDQNAFETAMPLYLMFANFADPFIT